MSDQDSNRGRKVSSPPPQTRPQQQQQQQQKSQAQASQNPQGQQQKGARQQRNKQEVVRGPSTRVQMDNPQKRKLATKKQIVQLKQATKEVTLFSHLPQFEKPTSVSLMAKDGDPIHPAIVNVGLKFSERIIMGSNARCVAMLNAFTIFIKDYDLKPFALELDNKMKPLIQFLEDCRPMSVAMRNAVKVVRGAIGKAREMSEGEAKTYVLDVIDEYKKQKVTDADK
eukprot:TRINITY_DN3965_c0_g1_i4.p1 TRINITY_DN3965_c0_g1~~TRINITY_DN3965_c0_g1_i4.p1  ORF type:complete len:226 (+),score=56.06 TRINITY_DN3965_c0_g1_i4:174-851(+)